MKQTRGSLRPRACALLLAAPLLLSLAVPAAHAASERETVRVGFFAFDGYHMMDENGERSGYGYDFLRLAARYMNVDFEYVGYEKGWDDMLGMLEAGEIDLVTSAQVTEERLKSFGFSKSTGTSSAMLTTGIENDSIVAGVYSTYDGIRIGVLEGNSRNEDLKEFAKKNGFTYEPVYFSLPTELEQALQDGEIDAILTSSLRETQNERLLNLFNAHDFYVIVRKEDTALLQKINYAIDQLNAAEGDWKNTLNNKYYEHLEEKVLTFTPEEEELIRQYAGGAEKLIVSVCTDKKPYAYTEDGEVKGILIDYFAKLAEYVGVPYEVAVPADRQEYLGWCNDETVANVFLDGRFASIQQAEDLGKAITAPYTTMRLVMVTRRDFDGTIDTLAVSTAQGLFGIEDGLASGARRVTVDSREEAMEAVLDGEAEATFVYLYSAQKFINQEERGLLTYTLLEEPTYEYRVVFASHLDHALSGIFTKAIYAMPEGTLEDIAAEYTSYKAKDVSLFTWFRIYPLQTVLILATFFLTYLFAVLLFERQKAIRLEKQRADELRELAAQAARANRAKSDFLANVSHDIRTPMNAIVGFAYLMEKETDDAEQMREYIRKIRFFSQHLLSLIDDVLDMSRIEANRVILNPEVVSLSEQIRQVEQISRGGAEARRQTFDVQIHAFSHDTVLADGVRLRQVLLNLLSNAIKYTPDGGSIVLDAAELPCEKEGCAAFCFTVTDNGCGMTQEFLTHIFDPFERSEASVTNKIQGTGLGMPITKNLVDAMGGEITVSSALGEGSQFKVALTLPIASVDEMSSGRKEGNILRGLNFLCAEDNALNAEILEATLEMYGAKCTICSDGMQIVELFEAVKPREYDAILMDIQMPGMNGLEAARAIRSGSNPLGASIPIIAMTANAFAEDVRRSVEAGMNAHISKPINASALEEAVRDFRPAHAADERT